MKTITKKHLILFGIVGVALAVSVNATSAASLLIDNFNTASQDTASWYFQNWNGSTGSIAFASDDANGSGSSGSIKLSTDFDNVSQQGGAYRFTHSADLVSPTAYTALEYDIKVDPSSALDQNGVVCDVKMGFSDSGYGLHNADLNISPVTTNGGWQHVVVPLSSVGGAGPQPIPEIVCQVYDNNYTSNGTAVIYIDNIQFTAPNPTYPDILALTFDNPTNVVTTGTTAWYGDAINTYEWSSLDASNNPNSGSLHVVCDFTSGDNSCVMAIPFDPLYPGFSSPTPDTNIVINAQQMQSVEMDIKWDVTNSTVGIDDFNSVGDVTGFPLGLLYNSPGGGPGGQSEAFGTATTSLPDAASNGWVHVSFPLNASTANIDQTVGLWLKKYQWNGALSGTVGFYIDNVKFIGGAIPQSGPPLTLSKPVSGLQEVHTVGQYDREGLVTANSGFTFVNQPNTTYKMNIAYMPPETGFSARVMLVPLSASLGVDGTVADPDWEYPNILLIAIQRNGTGSQLQLAAKIGQPNDNGSLYNAPAGLPSGASDWSVHPSFNTASPIEGDWTLAFTDNSHIAVTAPDGSSTNLTFPGVYNVETNGLDNTEVANNFELGYDMVAYFGSINGSVTGTRMVMGSASVTRSSTILVSDDFTADTTLDTPTTWLLASGGGATAGTYLLPHSIQWFLQWPVTFSGYSVQTNNDLTLSEAWNTNNITSSVLGSVYQANVDATNLPPSGNVFFRLKKY